MATANHRFEMKQVTVADRPGQPLINLIMWAKDGRAGIAACTGKGDCSLQARQLDQGPCAQCAIPRNPATATLGELWDFLQGK